MKTFMHTFAFILASVLAIGLHTQGNTLWALALVIALVNGCTALASALRPFGWLNRRHEVLTLREQRDSHRRMWGKP